MLFAESSDLVQIVSALIGLLGTIFAGVMTYLMARLNSNQRQAAVKVDEVKTRLAAATRVTTAKLDAVAVNTEAVAATLATTSVQTATVLEGIAATGHVVHGLVNNAMAVQLELNATVTRRLASLTGLAADAAAANRAEALYLEHQVKQAAIDAAAPQQKVEVVAISPAAAAAIKTAAVTPEKAS